jgi:hypothetical protein
MVMHWFWQKMAWATFWAVFFTNSSGHTASRYNISMTDARFPCRRNWVHSAAEAEVLKTASVNYWTTLLPHVLIFQWTAYITMTANYSFFIKAVFLCHSLNVANWN